MLNVNLPMQPSLDVPKSLSDPAVRAERHADLAEPHVAPLVEFVLRLREKMGDDHKIPHFDPLDGGILAECLFLLEAPGPKALASGFISRNNPDETAKNFFELNMEAGLDRTKTVIWNIVPWYVGTGTRIRAVNAADIRIAQPALTSLLDMLPALRAVVFVGRKAAKVRPYIELIRPRLQLFECAHTSPMNINRAPHNRGQILSKLHQIAVVMSVNSLRTQHVPAK